MISELQDSDFGDLSVVIACSQLSQDGQRSVNTIMWWCLNEVEFPRFGNTEHHQLQHRVSEVNSKDLRRGLRTHPVKLFWRVKPIAFSAVRATSATFALFGRRLGDPLNGQSADISLRIVAPLFHLPGVHDVPSYLTIINFGLRKICSLSLNIKNIQKLCCKTKQKKIWLLDTELFGAGEAK